MEIINHADLDKILPECSPWKEKYYQAEQELFESELLEELETSELTMLRGRVAAYRRVQS